MNNKNAPRSSDITDEMWLEVLEFNRNMAMEFLDNQSHLSDKSIKQYTSAIKIFFYWVKEKLNNKKVVDIKKKEFIRYLNWLTNRGLSTSSIKMKKSVISALCSYIVNFYEDEYPTFRPFVTSEMKVVQTGNVYDKQPLTTEEYKQLCKKLEELEKWQILAWLKFSYSTGCRREEARQLLKEVVDYPCQTVMVNTFDEYNHKVQVEAKRYMTHFIRCKGHSKMGKPRRLKFDDDAMQAIKKWLEVRGEDSCPYVFVTIDKDGVHHVSDSTFNHWCQGLLFKLVGRRFHPHMVRESRATNLVVEEGKSVVTAQKLLGHESSETTIKHYIIRDDEIDDSDEAFI